MRVRSYSFALAGLCAVVVAVGGFALLASQRTDDEALQAVAATRLANAYEQARYEVGAEESLERKYRLVPAAATRQSYDAAAVGFVGALEVARARGGTADVRLVDGLLVAQREYRAGMTRLFAAVDAHQQGRVLSIDASSDPVFAVIEARVDQAARADGAAADGKLHLLRTSERRVRAGTAIVIGVGLFLLGLFALVLVRVNRQLRRQALANEHNALHDELTGLPNRRLLVDRLAQLVAAAARDPEPFSLLMIDLDRFKEINDTLGHPTGDLLLQAVGPRLAPLLRPADTLARIGGDEFVLLLPTASTDAACKIAERALAILREPLPLPNFVATIDSSIGIVTFPTHGEDAETLMQRAEVAMCLAKTQQSENAVYDPKQDPFDPERLSLIADLRQAIAHQSIEVHYQPKFDTQTLRPTGVEALARWNHPTRGMIAPGAFIPLSEHAGLIKPLTELVLRQAVRQCRRWDEQGHDLPVAVNLSVANLLDIELVPTVRRILEEERVAPVRLRLEITEGTIMTDPDRAQRVLLELSEMGIALSVDDFGTGYSSLAYLRRLPVQELKIDRAFITHLADDHEDVAVVRATIQLGHSLGLTIVAEGVEDAASLRRLRELHCDTIQGFHLCRPQPPETLTAALRILARHTPRRPAVAGPLTAA